MPRFAPFEPDAVRAPDRARSVVVRPARADDAAAVVRVAETRGSQRPGLAGRVAGWTVDPGRCVLVATAAGERDDVVGWSMISRWAHDDAPAEPMISALTVHPDWWRRGVGRRLTSGLLAWTWARADRAWSLVNLRNEASLALHAELGFVEVRRGAELRRRELRRRRRRPAVRDPTRDRGGAPVTDEAVTSESTPYRVMTVCTGNICRSPMAEVILAERFRAAGLDGAVVVDSTGVSDEEHGNPIDRRAARVLTAHGYPVPDHRARQVEAEELAGRDLVLAMTASHARALRWMEPDVADRVRMLRSFDPAAPADAPERHLDVADPWYGPDEGFEDTLAEIEAAADGVVEHVREALAARGWSAPG